MGLNYSPLVITEVIITIKVIVDIAKEKHSTTQVEMAATIIATTNLGR